ncbi:MAG: GIY-YIG nuclease family protein [Chloroflexi bacterium]|nr:GIY-YIG nuclease family protein [Chloroflexota bacterium]
MEPRGQELDRQPGCYVLVLRLTRPTRLTVGRLGRLQLQPGWYVYVGSALGGLGPRLARHARRGKPLRWHVDYLREIASLEAVWVRPGTEPVECLTAQQISALPTTTVPALRFGSSDCRCRTHLFAFEQPPDLCLDAGWRPL